MKTSDYLPKNDRKLLQWVINFLNYLSVTLARFGFPLAVYDALEALRADFEEKLDIAEAPSTRTKGAIDDKNGAKKKLTKDVRAAVLRYLTYNPDVTDKDRDDLGIPIHKTTRTPAPVAETFPDFDIDTSIICCLIIHFFDRGQKKTKAKPPGQHGAEIRWMISEVPMVDANELIHSSFDTRTPFTLEFGGHERGKTVYFALRWENTRGQKGHWSPIQNAFIP
jgi:hypothetical protein